MYWNADNSKLSYSTAVRLIETWDVLKLMKTGRRRKELERLIETWDVLKWLHCREHCPGIWINRNMRCIEICPFWPNSYNLYRLIETWDVLKFCLLSSELNSIWINRNMRCIEIRFAVTRLCTAHSINRNMRCIEICKS